MTLKELLQFGRARPAVASNGQKPHLTRRLWSLWRTDEQDVEKLKSLAASARRIQELMQHSGWQDILAAKHYYLSSYDAQTKQLTISPDGRLIAAATWNGIEGFFKELSLRIKAGDEAHAKLKEMKQA